MGNWIRLCWAVLLLGSPLALKADEPLSFITEAYPPYNFRRQHPARDCR